MNKVLKQMFILLIISFVMVSCKLGEKEDDSSSSSSSNNFTLEGESGGN